MANQDMLDRAGRLAKILGPAASQYVEFVAGEYHERTLDAARALGMSPLLATRIADQVSKEALSVFVQAMRAQEALRRPRRAD